MDVTTLSISKKEAEREFEEYKEAMKNNKTKYLRQMKTMYSHLKKGRKVLDIYDVFKKTGTKNGLPKLAIVRADQKEVLLNSRGNFCFMKRSNSSSGFNYTYRASDVSLPSETFPRLKEFEHKAHERKAYKAKVPVIPAHLLPSGNLKNYHILWEVENWQKVTLPPKDPFLLKRISKNIFVILAFWNLTPLEQALTRGR
jgi:hypothetical protein